MNLFSLSLSFNLQKTKEEIPRVAHKGFIIGLDRRFSVKSLLVYIQEPVGLTKNQSEKLNHNGSCLGIPWIYNLLSLESWMSRNLGFKSLITSGRFLGRPFFQRQHNINFYIFPFHFLFLILLWHSLSLLVPHGLSLKPLHIF